MSKICSFCKEKLPPWRVVAAQRSGIWVIQYRGSLLGTKSMIGGLHGAGAVVLIEVGTIMKTAGMKSVRCAVNCCIFVIAK